MNYTIVGIDFGTSTTVVKVKNYSDGMNKKDCQTLMFGSYPYLPTLIFEDEDKRLYFGNEAESQSSASIKGTMYSNFKMGLIGNSEQQTQAKRLIKKFFEHIYTEFNKQRHILNVYDDIRTYVSYPAKWMPDVRSLMKQCAEDAGFTNVSGESEPTAAIYASFANRLEELQKEHIVIVNQPISVMMLDMGAGTSDIAIFKFKIDNSNKMIIDNLTTYPTIDNAYLCGGREIDKLLSEHLCNYVKSVSTQINEGFLKQIKGSTKSWKESTVSQQLEENKIVGLPSQISTVMSMFPQNRPFENIDRRQFELITKVHWKQLYSLIADAIKEAKVILPNGAADIDLVILTGGHSKWYGVKEFILGNDFAALEPIHFARIQQQPLLRLLQEPRPQETVAHGLAFKDLPFNIKHTMGNSLWVQFEIDGQKSELFNPVLQHDVLPIKDKQLKWELSIKSHSLTAKEVKVICHCFYGSSREKSIHKKEERVFPINDFVAAVVGGVFRTAGAAIGEAWNLVTFQWDKLGKSTEYCFEETYTVKISTTINVSEDGTGKITGTLGSDWNNGAPFEITQ